ncbi:hypothetical protein ACJX0J_036189, partial [Zea mays]
DSIVEEGGMMRIQNSSERRCMAHKKIKCLVKYKCILMTLKMTREETALEMRGGQKGSIITHKEKNFSWNFLNLDLWHYNVEGAESMIGILRVKLKGGEEELEFTLLEIIKKDLFALFLDFYNESGFIRGRFILDSDKQNDILLKIDFEKAYDKAFGLNGVFEVHFTLYMGIPIDNRKIGGSLWPSTEEKKGNFLTMGGKVTLLINQMVKKIIWNGEDTSFCIKNDTRNLFGEFSQSGDGGLNNACFNGLLVFDPIEGFRSLNFLNFFSVLASSFIVPDMLIKYLTFLFSKHNRRDVGTQPLRL